MRKISTIASLKAVLFVVMLSLSFGKGWGQIFQQDFNTSTIVADYVNAASPTAGQFNAISTSGSGVTASINTTGSNKLRFSRTSANAGSFSRTTDLSPAPLSLLYKFDLTVSGTTTAATNFAAFQVGTGFGTTNSGEANTSTYARLGLNATATNGTFQLRDITGSTNSPNLSGTVAISWYMNNSGNSITYTAPDGTSETVANDRVDIWGGNSKLFNDVSVETSSLTSLTDLKFVISGGTNVNVDIDNIVITTIPIVAAPAVTTNAASLITTTGATLNGTLSSNGATTTVTFNYGLTISYILNATATQSPLSAGSTNAAVSAAVSSLAVNTQYNFRASGNSTAGTTDGSNLTFYTLANAPNAPVVNNATNSSLDVAIGASDGNPSSTEYAMQEAGGLYVQAGGTLGASVAWQTATAWGTKTVIGLAASTAYTFKVKARNGANVETAFGATAGGTTATPSTPTILTSGTLVTLSTTYGTPSANTTFTASGVALTDNILVTAPSGFEISQTVGGGSGFSTTQTLVQSGGTVASTTIYVRLAATASAGAHSGNVVLTSTDATTVNVATASSTVTTKALTISGLTANGKEYDRTTVADVTGTPAYSGLVNGETFSVTGTVTWAYADALVGVSKPLARTGLYDAPSANYTVTQPALSATIAQKSLTIGGAAAQDKIYNNTPAAVISGSLVGVISPDIVTLNGTGTFADVNVGTGIAVTSTSTLSGADAANYSLTQPTGLTANITKASQTITFGTLPAKTNADFDFSANASASSGLLVTLVSSNTAVATIVSGNIHIVGVGTSNITASQAGNGNYDAAPDVIQTLTVTQASGTLGTYTFNGTACAAATLTASSVVTNVSFSSASVTGETCNNNSSTSYSVGGASWGTSFSATRYIEFTITPATNYLLTLSSLSFDHLRSGAGAMTLNVRSSADNFTADLTTATTVGTTSANKSISLTGSAFSSAPTAITFRIYGWGGNSTGDFRIDNITLSGFINSAPGCNSTPVAGTASATNSSFCGSGSTTISASGYSTGASGITFQWFSSTDNVTFTAVGSPSATVSALPTGTINQTTYYYNKAICTNTTGSSVSNTVTVTITPTPVVTVFPASQSICSGSNVSLTASGATTYAWSPSTGLSANTGTTVTASPSATTTYTVIGTTNGCASAGTNVSITVTATPTALTMSPASATICDGSTQQLTSSGGAVAKTITSGSGTFTTVKNTTDPVLGPNPLQNYYGGSKQQSIYQASELNALGFTSGSVITAIKFNLAASNSTSLTNFAVKMGLTTVSSYASTTSWITTNLTTVTSASSITPAVGLNTIALTSPFTWDGVSNLVLETSYSNNNSGAGGTNTAKYSATTFQSTLFYRVDKVTAAAMSSYTEAASNLYSLRSDVVFEVNDFPITWSPTAGLFTNAAATAAYVAGTAATTVYAKPTASTTYTATATNGTCSTTATSVITVNPPSVPGTISGAATVCAGTNSTPLTLNGYTGTIQWQSSADNVTFANIAGETAATYTATNLTSTTYYRALVTSGVCSAATSNTATVTVTATGTWTAGAGNTNWNDAGNWCGGVPTSATNVTIPVVGSGLYPVLSAATGAVNNLTIAAGAALTVTAQTLQIAGTISNSGTFTATAGIIELNGSDAQTIPASAFAANTLQSMVISNNVTLAGPLSITDVLSFGAVSSKTLNSGGHLTLVSTNTTTARVADVTNAGANTGNTITGNVTVERGISNKAETRGWRWLTVPLANANSIRDAWQIGGGDNYIQGKGTHITGPGGLNGLDAGNTYSMRTYDPSTNSYLNIASTLGKISDHDSYFIFIRGDRKPSNLTPSSANSTTLSATGTLKTGTQTVTAAGGANLSLNMFVGNPYASPVDFSKLGLSNVDERFWAFNPYQGDGAYVLLDGKDGYVNLLGNDFEQTVNIQSGQAILVKRIVREDASSVTFTEAAKSILSTPNVFRGNSGVIASLTSSLYRVNGGTTAYVDGVSSRYNADYAAAVNAEDAPKVNNLGENLAIARDGSNLTIERRPEIAGDDTIFLQLWNTTIRNYQLKFTPANFVTAGVSAFLEDNYLKTSTPVSTSDITFVPFSVTSDVNSSAINRFRIVFKTNAVLPINFTNVKAYQKGNDIQVEWNLGNESSISRYEVEKSADGRTFTKTAAQAVRAITSSSQPYNWLDASATSGNNFYRIKAIEQNGQYKYSQVVNVKLGTGNGGISIYPNPVKGNNMSLQFINQPKGKYAIQLFNNLGQEVYRSEFNHIGGSSTQTVQLNNQVSKGIYQLQVTNGDNKVTQKVIID
jgi:hypothetical protein